MLAGKVKGNVLGGAAYQPRSHSRLALELHMLVALPVHPTRGAVDWLLAYTVMEVTTVG